MTDKEKSKIDFLDFESPICDLKHSADLLIDIFVSEPDVRKSIAKMDLMFRLIEERANELYTMFYQYHENQAKSNNQKVTELKQASQ